MKSPIKLINQKIQRIKLSQSKAITSLGLAVFTHNKKDGDVIFKKNIAYGKNRLQKFDLICPKNSQNTSLPVVFYVHGGSWCGGDKYGYTMFCKNIAKQGYVVANINYRLMPKVSIKTCVADCVKAIRYLMTNQPKITTDLSIDSLIDFDNVFLIGDSAGAHIVSLIAGKQTSGKIKLKINIKALGLYYGVFDFNGISHDPSPIMTDLDAYWKSIYPSTAELYKSISPTTYVTNKFPPTFMTSGEIDRLHFQSEVMFRLLKYSNVEVEYLSFEKSRQDARHAFLNAPFLRSAKEAFEHLSKFLEKHKN